MNLTDLIDKNTSKKASVTVLTISVLAYIGAHPAYIAAVAIVELLIQGWLDRPNIQGERNEDNNNSNVPAGD